MMLQNQSRAGAKKGGSVFLFALVLSLGLFASTLPATALAFCTAPAANCECSTSRGGTQTCVDSRDGSRTIDGAPQGQQGNTGALPPASAAAQPQAPAANNSQTGLNQGALNTDFKPLTQIPAITEAAANSGSLSAFLNTLYKLCIGVAAALAVLQIMRAGIMYMSPDSITEKSEARSLIGWSLFGLLLVLAPTIVFGLIDPRILKLDIDSSIQRIAPSLSENPGSSAPVAPSQPTNGALSTGEEFPIGSTVSCLYPGGGRGNKIGTVLALISSSVSGNLLRIQFTDQTLSQAERITSPVAPGDCRGYQANVNDTAALGEFAVGNTVYCKPFPPQFSKGTVASIDTTRGWLTVNFVSRDSGRRYTESASASTCLKEGADSERRLCGEPPDCNAGCLIANDGTTDLCTVDSY